MKIEILYPERCNLYGDLANMDYLRKCLPQAEFVETPLGETPQFAREKVDMVYLGPMTEQAQEQVLEQLFPLKERLQELVEQDVVFLCTGNALELFGEAIFKEDGSRIPCLGLFPLTAQRDMMHRHNSVFLGSFETGPVTGFKSQFTTAKTSSGELKLFGVEKGMGLNKKCPFEGVRAHNFFGTYLSGAAADQQPAIHQVLALPAGGGFPHPGL